VPATYPPGQLKSALALVTRLMKSFIKGFIDVRGEERDRRERERKRAEVALRNYSLSNTRVRTYNVGMYANVYIYAYRKLE
jgi:short subunit dehydrogenase-like uncharacterized protein